MSRYYQIKPDKLKAVRRGIVNEPRDVAIYLIRSMRSEPLMQVGAGFGLNRYSSVSSAVMRVKIKLQKDRKFKNRFGNIANNIIKGQTKTWPLYSYNSWNVIIETTDNGQAKNKKYYVWGLDLREIPGRP